MRTWWSKVSYLGRGKDMPTRATVCTLGLLPLPNTSKISQQAAQWKHEKPCHRRGAQTISQVWTVRSPLSDQKKVSCSMWEHAQLAIQWAGDISNEIQNDNVLIHILMELLTFGSPRWKRSGPSVHPCRDMTSRRIPRTGSDWWC